MVPLVGRMADWIFGCPLLLPRQGLEGDCLVIFGLPGHMLVVSVGVVCFGWVLGFSRLSTLLLIDARFCVGVFCGEFDPGSG